MIIYEILGFGEYVGKGFIDPAILKKLKELGYTSLGRGYEQAAFLAPDGTVLKIFSTSKDGKDITFNQQRFIKFYQYCKAHPNNPFLPQFMDFSKFNFNGRVYLQIKMERLFKMPTHIASELEVLVDYATMFNSSKQEYFEKEKDEQGTIEFLSYLGQQQFDLLWKTIIDLEKWSRSNLGANYLDLGPDNFMLGSDGQIVISDPFYFGYLD